jgi:hypothetical protein
MRNDDWFDSLAKDSAQGLSRRQVFRRLFGGIGVALLGVVGLSAAGNGKDCGQLCQTCCHNFFPDHGKEYGQCVSDCHQGEGLCGPVVCPKD